jgi:hypothetical protein
MFSGKSALQPPSAITGGAGCLKGTPLS